MIRDRRKSSLGFTLLEMMITIVILASLTILTSQSIQQGLRQKLNIQNNIDDYAVVRDAIQIIKNDINRAFHYRDLEEEFDKILNKELGPRAPGENNPELQNQMIQNQQEKNADTHFVGLNDELHFVTMTNTRTISDAQEADFGEVGYTLKDCTNRSSGHQSQCLWRRFSPFTDDDVTLGGREIPLLENVQEFKLRYFGEGKQDWVNEWRSTEGGDAVTKGNFPQIVELTMLIRGGATGEGREIPVQTIIPIHFPNNEKESTNEQNQTQQNQVPRR